MQAITPLCKREPCQCMPAYPQGSRQISPEQTGPVWILNAGISPGISAMAGDPRTLSIQTVNQRDSLALIRAVTIPVHGEITSSDWPVWWAGFPLSFLANMRIFQCVDFKIRTPGPETAQGLVNHHGACGKGKRLPAFNRQPKKEPIAASLADAQCADDWLDELMVSRRHTGRDRRPGELIYRWISLVKDSPDPQEQQLAPQPGWPCSPYLAKTQEKSRAHFEGSVK